MLTFWSAALSVFDGVLGTSLYRARSLSSSSFSISSSRVMSLTASANSFQVIVFSPMSLVIGLGSFFRVDATNRLFVSGISPARCSTLSAHMTCDNSSSAPMLAATLLPKSPIIRTISSSKACFSAVVFSMMALTGQWILKAFLVVVKDTLSAFCSVVNHAAAGVFAFMDKLKKQTFSILDNSVFMRIMRSSLFIKS